MDPNWPVLEIVLLAVGLLAIAGGVFVMIGGLGERRDLKSAVRSLQSDLEVVDRRITSEVKARASAKAVEVRNEDRTIEQQAADILAKGPQVVEAPSRRPTIFRN